MLQFCVRTHAAEADVVNGGALAGGASNGAGRENFQILGIGIIRGQCIRSYGSSPMNQKCWKWTGMCIKGWGVLPQGHVSLLQGHGGIPKGCGGLIQGMVAFPRLKTELE